MEVPAVPYIALYGSNNGAWRAPVTAMLDREGIAWFDPTNDEWDSIDWSNGDTLQPTIDRLVKREQDALLGARCALWHIGRTIFDGDKPTEKSTEAFASRLELGVLLGRGMKTWVVVDDDVTGRNYLRAAVRAHAMAVLCANDREAAGQAIAWWKSR